MEGSTAQQQLYRSMYFLSYHRRRSPEAGGLTDQEITRQALFWLAAESVGNGCSSTAATEPGRPTTTTTTTTTT